MIDPKTVTPALVRTLADDVLIRTYKAYGEEFDADIPVMGLLANEIEARDLDI